VYGGALNAALLRPPDERAPYGPTATDRF